MAGCMWAQVFHRNEVVPGAGIRSSMPAAARGKVSTLRNCALASRRRGRVPCTAVLASPFRFWVREARPGNISLSDMRNQEVFQ